MASAARRQIIGGAARPAQGSTLNLEESAAYHCHQHWIVQKHRVKKQNNS